MITIDFNEIYIFFAKIISKENDQKINSTSTKCNTKLTSE